MIVHLAARCRYVPVTSNVIGRKRRPELFAGSRAVSHPSAAVQTCAPAIARRCHFSGGGSVSLGRVGSPASVGLAGRHLRPALLLSSRLVPRPPRFAESRVLGRVGALARLGQTATMLSETFRGVPSHNSPLDTDVLSAGCRPPTGRRSASR